MYKKNIMVFVYIVIIVVVSLSGCINGNDSNQQKGVISGLKTCAELHGYICNESIDCNGTWLNAVDSFRCCSCECELAIDESDILLFDSFDETPENEDIGEVTP